MYATLIFIFMQKREQLLLYWYQLKQDKFQKVSKNKQERR